MILFIWSRYVVSSGKYQLSKHYGVTGGAARIALRSYAETAAAGRKQPVRISIFQAFEWPLSEKADVQNLRSIETYSE